MKSGIPIIRNTIPRGNFDSTERKQWNQAKVTIIENTKTIIDKIKNHNLDELIQLIDYIQFSVNNNEFEISVALKMISTSGCNILSAEEQTLLITYLQALAERSDDSSGWFNITMYTDHLSEIVSYIKEIVFQQKPGGKGRSGYYAEYSIAQTNDYLKAARKLRLDLFSQSNDITAARKEFLKVYLMIDQALDIYNVDQLVIHLLRNNDLISKIQLKTIQENKELVVRFELLFNPPDSIDNGSFLTFTDFIAMLHGDLQANFQADQTLVFSDETYENRNYKWTKFILRNGQPKESLIRKYEYNIREYQIIISPESSWSSNIFTLPPLKEIDAALIGINYNQTDLTIKHISGAIATVGSSYRLYSFGAYQEETLCGKKSVTDATCLLNQRIFPVSERGDSTKAKILIEFRVLKQLVYPYCEDSQIFDTHCSVMQSAINNLDDNRITYCPFWINSFAFAGKTISEQNSLAYLLDLCTAPNNNLTPLGLAARTQLQRLLNLEGCYTDRSKGIYIFSLVRILASQFPQVKVACGCKSAKDRTASLIAASNLIIMLATEMIGFDFLDEAGYIRQSFLNANKELRNFIITYINDPLNRLVYSYTGIGRLNNKNLDLFCEIFKNTDLYNLIGKNTLVSTSA